MELSVLPVLNVTKPTRKPYPQLENTNGWMRPVIFLSIVVASVRIVDVDHYYYYDEDSDYSLTISAQNSFGATSSTSYYITSDGKIYDAIQEYCKAKGWK